jgi:AcrR family transcriptional regulator
VNKHGNIRSTASKSKIRDATLALLGEKPLAKITVQEIVKKAGVNRSTFYAHYVDVYDLMEKIESEILGPVPNEALYGEINKIDGGDTTRLKQLVASFRENRVFYRIYFSSFSESQRVKEASLQMRQFFIRPYLEQAKHFEKEEFDLQFEFCKAGFFGVIRTWLNHDCTEPDDVVVGLLYKLFRKCLG